MNRGMNRQIWVTRNGLWANGAVLRAGQAPALNPCAEPFFHRDIGGVQSPFNPLVLSVQAYVFNLAECCVPPLEEL